MDFTDQYALNSEIFNDLKIVRRRIFLTFITITTCGFVIYIYDLRTELYFLSWSVKNREYNFDTHRDHFTTLRTFTPAISTSYLILNWVMLSC